MKARTEKLSSARNHEYLQVEITIEAGIESEWLDWMTRVHVPDVVRTGCFFECHIYQVVESAAADPSYTCSILPIPRGVSPLPGQFFRSSAKGALRSVCRTFSRGSPAPRGSRPGHRNERLIRWDLLAGFGKKSEGWPRKREQQAGNDFLRRCRRPASDRRRSSCLTNKNVANSATRPRLGDEPGRPAFHNLEHEKAEESEPRKLDAEP